MKWLLILLPFVTFGQTITLTPIGTQDVSGIPVQVEHFVNYVPNHSIASVSYNPLGTTGTSVSLGDNSSIFNWEDIYWCYMLYSNNFFHNK